MTLQLPEPKFDELKEYLESIGFKFEDRPHQVFLARYPGLVVNLYSNGKIVLAGKDEQLQREVEAFIDSLGGITVEKPARKEEVPSFEGITRIGTDEVGKGDYFGPLVIAGVLVDRDSEEKLKKIGVRDSKNMSDTTISNLSIQIRKVLGWKRYEEIWISPIKYNILYKKMKNLNRILGWGHARAIENLLSNGVTCELAVADQFGDQSYITSALMKKGKKIDLVQMPRAEQDIAVASASILARDVFLKKAREMGENYGVEFSKGSSHVLDFAKEFVATHGISALQNVAKMHFKTTEKVTGGIIPEVVEDVSRMVDIETEPRKYNEKERDNALLECYNLIMAFEIELRRFIKRELSRHYGPDWEEKSIVKYIRERCEKIRKREEEKTGKKVELVNCLQFAHYQNILTDKRNWEEVFKKVFKDKEMLRARLKVLNDVRNAVAHSREDFSPDEKRDCIASVSYFRKMII
jgi:ribonuclease HIII